MLLVTLNPVVSTFRAHVAVSRLHRQNGDGGVASRGMPVPRLAAMPGSSW